MRNGNTDPGGCRAALQHRARSAEMGPAGYSWSMSKDKNKKRTAKTNKPKLTPKEKKLKKLAKKGK